MKKSTKLDILWEFFNKNFKITSWAILLLMLVNTFYAAKILNTIHYQNNILYPKMLKLDRNFDKLASKMGYGGMIHYYYLCLIHAPEQPEKCARADQKARDAISITYEIESASRPLGIDPGLKSIRTSFSVFQKNIRDIVLERKKSNNLYRIYKKLDIIEHPTYSKYATARETIRKVIKNHAIELNGNYKKLYTTGVFLLLLIFTLIAYFYKQSSRIESAFQQALTARKLALANVKLRDSNEALAQFASVASHDLKAPVRHVALFADAIRRVAGDNPVILEHIDNITQSASEMNALVNSLLTFSKSGFRHPKFADCNLEEILDSTRKSTLSSRNDVVLSLQINKNFPRIFADQNLLKQAIGNVLSNSVKYVSQGKTPEIAIEVHKVNDFIVISISDNGIGIPANLAEAVFQPMRRLHGADSVYEGTGLGLTLVRTIMRAHGGDAHIDTSYFDGTRVVLSFPDRPLDGD